MRQDINLHYLDFINENDQVHLKDTCSCPASIPLGTAAQLASLHHKQWQICLGHGGSLPTLMAAFTWTSLVSVSVCIRLS